MEKCPNCNIELRTTKFSDLENDERSFDVWITYCSNCGYIADCEAE